MIFNVFKNTVLLFVLIMISCTNLPKYQSTKPVTNTTQKTQTLDKSLGNKAIISGANQTDMYLSFLKGKQVGVVANPTSVIFKQIAKTSTISHNRQYTHLIDSLLSLNIAIKKVFAPEHGFRGTKNAGEFVNDSIDTKTLLPIISLYGNNKKPTQEQLNGLDIIIFDIQDVGARFYTYISTLHYIMEACAEAKIPILLLDRPNPNGHYMDGPILEKEYASFVGMHPIPIVHGMTIGEYAQMINGEKWLANEAFCELKIVPVKNYKRDLNYELPIKPSPNLPNNIAINLYPSLCLFEGTTVSVGRGTNVPFQVFGSPFFQAEKYDFTFIPQPNDGAKYPKHQDTICRGKNLIFEKRLKTINLKWLIEAYKNSENKRTFFNSFFTKLAGTTKLQEQIEAGLSETDIKKTWYKGLETFNQTRSNYLIYK